MNELSYYQSLPYQRRSKPVREDDGSFYWLAWVEELPGCTTDGATEAEAMYNLIDCFNGYVETMLKINRDIPLPARMEHTAPSSPSIAVLKTMEFPFPPGAQSPTRVGAVTAVKEATVLSGEEVVS